MKLPPGKYNLVTVSKEIDVREDGTTRMVQMCVVASGPHTGQLVSLGETITGTPTAEEQQDDAAGT